MKIPKEPSESRSRSRGRRKKPELKPAQSSRKRSRSPSPRPPRGPPPTMVPGPQAKPQAKQRAHPDFYPDGQIRIIHDQDVIARKNDWENTGDERLDFDPEILDSEVLDGFFEGKPKNRNFMFYHLGSVADDTEKKIRVNGKWWPHNTSIQFPNNMRSMKKTTLIRRSGWSEWELFEDRVAMGLSSPIKSSWSVEKCLVFALPKRYLEADNEDTAFHASVASIPSLQECSTMTKKQRATFKKGALEVAERDSARSRLLRALGDKSEGKCGDCINAECSCKGEESSSEEEGFTAR